MLNLRKSNIYYYHGSRSILESLVIDFPTVKTSGHDIHVYLTPN